MNPNDDIGTLGIKEMQLINYVTESRKTVCELEQELERIRMSVPFDKTRYDATYERKSIIQSSIAFYEKKIRDIRKRTAYLVSLEKEKNNGQQQVRRTVYDAGIHTDYIYDVTFSQNQVSDKKSDIAMLLCLIGGIFGAHRFYVGKTASGLLYLLTGGLFLVGVIFDFSCIARYTFTDDQGKVLV